MWPLATSIVANATSLSHCGTTCLSLSHWEEGQSKEVLCIYDFDGVGFLAQREFVAVIINNNEKRVFPTLGIKSIPVPLCHAVVCLRRRICLV